MYAFIQNDTIVKTGNLPRSARRLDTAAWVMGLATAPVSLQQACGWYEIVDTPRPADTDTHTHEQAIELVAGVPTVVWTQRAWTAEELAANEAAGNDAALRADPQAQIDLLLASITALQTVTNTSNATINGSPASYVKDVAREAMTIARRTVRLARLQLGALDSTEGV